MLNSALKKSVLYCLLLFFTILTNAQVQYEKGYFLDNTNTKTECFIKNIDWRNSPKEFSYKLDQNSTAKTVSIDDVSKFEIYDISIYLRATVAIAENTTASNKLDFSDKLKLKDEQVFLKLLVEGSSNLYLYKNANTLHYYYQLNDDTPKILEYKEYINENNQVVNNNNYKSQLWTNLKCNSISMNEIKDLKYREKDMINFMSTYNTCMNDLTYTFKDKKRDNVFNVSIRPGIDFSSANIDTPGNNSGLIRDLDFDQESSFRIGIELEYVLPINNNKWSLIMEPTYHSYSTETNYNSTPTSTINRPKSASVEYSHLELPFGVRHYSFLNANSRLFANASFILNIPFDASVDFNALNYEIDTNSNIALGFGYSYKYKYSVEARLFTSRDLLDKFTTVSSTFNNFSLIFGYTIF
jgi:hypothetical protein